MKILISGGSGFIGSHLAEHLASKKHKVRILDNFSVGTWRPTSKSGIEVFEGDVRYMADIFPSVQWADVIYHLAAQISVDKSLELPQETMDINIQGTENILEAIRVTNLSKRMIFASTSEIYGTQYGRISEDSPNYPQSPYAVSKLAADKLCGVYHLVYGVRVIRARMFNTYGPRQRFDKFGAVIPRFVHSALFHTQPIVYGTGEQRRDFMYVSDAVKAYETLLGYPQLEGDVINIGTGNSVRINEVWNIISEITKSKLNPRYIPGRPGEVMKLQANNTVASRCDIRPNITLREGLNNYITWAKNAWRKEG